MSKPFWVEHLEGRIGWSEFDHDRQIAKDWPLCGLSYKTVIGTTHAWCGLACEIALHSGGLKGPHGSAGAASWAKFGEPCSYICGAFLPIRHKSGGHHITVFLYWVDKDKRLAACLGGNQGDRYRVSTYNLSGNKAGHDEVVPGPRWPKGYPKTDFVYPHGKSEEGGSTR